MAHVSRTGEVIAAYGTRDYAGDDRDAPAFRDNPMVQAIEAALAADPPPALRPRAGAQRMNRRVVQEVTPAFGSPWSFTPTKLPGQQPRDVQDELPL
ncbi:MAG: hypothetical protein R3B72_50195 [Polyangiaceae bacterium]